MSVGVNVRIRRTRIEYAYVDVLVTDDLVTEERRLDAAAIFRRAEAIGAEPDIVWHPESTVIECHSIQRPVGEGECIYYHLGHPAREGAESS